MTSPKACFDALCRAGDKCIQPDTCIQVRSHLNKVETELAPCPFCGAPAKEEYDAPFTFIECSARCRKQLEYRNEAVAQWNARTQPTGNGDYADEMMNRIADIIHRECFVSTDNDSRCERAAGMVWTLITETQRQNGGSQVNDLEAAVQTYQRAYHEEKAMLDFLETHTARVDGELTIPSIDRINAEIDKAIRALGSTPQQRGAMRLSDHGCLTGDCPHEHNNECLIALRDYAAELDKKQGDNNG